MFLVLDADWPIQCSSFTPMAAMYRIQQLILNYMSGLDILAERWYLMLNKMTF